MSQDLRSNGRRNEHSATPLLRRDEGKSIGFHELRQACEISSLREDLERVIHETQGLRDEIEDCVDQVRARFLALSEEDMARSESMAPLLEFAVTTLLELRERARIIDLSTGPLPDDDRPAWSGTIEPSRRPGPEAVRGEKTVGVASGPEIRAVDAPPPAETKQDQPSPSDLTSHEAPVLPPSGTVPSGSLPSRPPPPRPMPPRPEAPRGLRPPPAAILDDAFWLQPADIPSPSPVAPEPVMAAPVIPAPVGTVLSEQTLQRARQPASTAPSPLDPLAPTSGPRGPGADRSPPAPARQSPPAAASFLSQAAPIRPDEETAPKSRKVDWLGPARR